MGSKLVKFDILTFAKARVIGKKVVQKLDIGIDDSTIQDLWAGMTDDGSLDFLFTLPERSTKTPDRVGWMGDFKPGDEEYTYLAGVLVNHNTPVPEGYEYRDIANCEMAIGWIQRTEDDNGGDIHVNASEHISKAIQENGYEYDSTHGFFEMEYYSYERFNVPEERGGNVILDFYTPCKKQIK
ncbi:hypothetical protein [Abyssisolibacter fermentans]|uniref:hypothetical protein n=1 Tax=Abyssisolibacter fermentans TaxID=1766203 RepID=UPI00082C0295|nr:hypothetical protein [Abyssisolibacter fermentans]